MEKERASVDKTVEVWLRMYEEQVRHGRHHETLRSQSTNIVVVVSAALLAFSGRPEVKETDVLIGGFIVVINLYGFVMSLKHYERSRLHVGVAGSYREHLASNLNAQCGQLNGVRRDAKDKHKSENKILTGVRAFYLWAGLHLMLALSGGAVALK